MQNIYQQGLDKNTANYTPLTPLTFIARTAYVYPGAHRGDSRPASLHLGGDLPARPSSGFGTGGPRALARAIPWPSMLNNTPEMVECHFGVPATGAVLNTLNTRLDAETIAFMLEHGEARVLITDREYSPTVRKALAATQRQILVIDVDDSEYSGPGQRLGTQEYESFIAAGSPDFPVGRSERRMGCRSRSITPREPPAIRRASSITIAAPTSIR
jgi:fatty-acyl-CoA synthase